MGDVAREAEIWDVAQRYALIVPSQYKISAPRAIT